MASKQADRDGDGDGDGRRQPGPLKMYNYLRGFIRLPILNFSSRPETEQSGQQAGGGQAAVLGEQQRQWQLHGHGRRQTINKRPNVCNELYTVRSYIYIYIVSRCRLRFSAAVGGQKKKASASASALALAPALPF